MPRPTATSVEVRLKYILKVISYTELGKPDYAAIATATGQSSANNVQKKFKSYIEQAGFSLIDRQIVRPEGNGGNNNDDDDAASPSPSPVPKRTGVTARSKKTANTRSTSKVDSAKPRAPKKRKVSEIIELSDDEATDNDAEDAAAKTEVPEGEDKTDSEADEDESDRSRRSRARSPTMKAEEVV